MGTILMILLLVICMLLIIVVLLQKGRGGGVGAMFGGGGAGSAFGTRTGDVMTWVTIVLTGLFLLLTIVTTVVVRPPASKIVTPTFEPSAWPEGQEPPLSVNIRCETRGAKVHYTLDGSEPTQKSLQYISALRIKPGQTLRAKAFRAGLEPSETAERTFVPPTPETQPTAPERQPVSDDADTRADAPTTQPAGEDEPTPDPQPATEPAPAPAG
jgi:protein translocase SecG subunit